MVDLDNAEATFINARDAYEADPTDSQLHEEYVDAMQAFSEARREWRVVEEEAGRRVPGIIAEVNN